MYKEYIIDMLEDTDIKDVTNILIELELYGKDRVRIDYMDWNGNFKMIEQYFKDGIPIREE